MREQYMYSGEGFLLVYSITDKRRCSVWVWLWVCGCGCECVGVDVYISAQTVTIHTLGIGSLQSLLFISTH